MQTATGLERHCGLIRKLAFMKRSRLQTACQNHEHDTGEGLGLRQTPASFLSLQHHGNRVKMEPWNRCLFGPVDMPRPVA